MFPVEEHPVFVRFSNGQNHQFLGVPEKKAIVDRPNRRVLGIVGRDYRLVTNREALEMAFQCAGEAFPETGRGEWEVKAVDAPFSRGYCYMDLVHNSTALDFTFVPAAERPDTYGPFVRMTNSYNTLRALTFCIGFYRKVCQNGLILPDAVIQFRFTHSRHDIGTTIEFEVSHERLQKLNSNFQDYLGALRDCTIRRAEFDPLVHSVLLLHQPKPSKRNAEAVEDWSKLSTHIGEICNRYSNELGENAYAAFSVITEFAAHPLENRCVRRDRHGFQRLAGSWITDFSKECRQPGFSLPRYLEKVTGMRSASTSAHRDQAT